MIWVFGCTENNPVEPEDPVPVILSVRVPGRIWTGTETDVLVCATVTDAQGLGDIDTVSLTVLRPDSLTVLFSTLLNDSAERGDLIALDGMYSRQIKTSVVNSEIGNYYFLFRAVDRDGHGSEAVSETVPVLSGVMNDPPHISDIILPEIVSVDTSIQYSFNVYANDPQGVSDMAFLIFRIHRKENPTVTLMDTIYDDGIEPDVSAEDGIFTGTFTTDFADSIIGVYPFSFQVFDKEGDSTDFVRRDVEVINEANAPPHIFNLSAPDTLSRQAGADTLSIEVIDPQGYDDIRRVYFNVTKPDSSPALGNPFQMRDDGQGGDVTAHDGVYSLGIIITPDNDPGEYTFVFEAEDLSGSKSNVIVHIITVL